MSVQEEMCCGNRFWDGKCARQHSWILVVRWRWMIRKVVNLSLCYDEYWVRDV